MTHAYEHETATRDRHSLMGLVKDLRDETTLLFRQEGLLLRREMQEKFDHVKRNGIAIVSGAVMVGLGLVFLLLAASNGLTAAYVEAGMDPDVAVWMGPLTVGLLMTIGGAALAWWAIKRLETEKVTPQKTIESLEETGQWAKHRVANI
ncbi:MAG TPA: phage holin family protein [Phycisphaerales bacterium]|nr:phage holin family protein [Phycisphaerales bacterium]